MSAKRLFVGPTPHQFAQAAEESATRMVEAFTEGQLLGNSLDDLAQAVMDDKVPRPIVLDVAHHWTRNEILSSAAPSDDSWFSVYGPSSRISERELLNRPPE